MFTKVQSCVIIGSLLGDGGLNATGGGEKYRFSVTHSQAQKEYLFWKYNFLKKYVRSVPKFQFANNSWRFSTLSNEAFTKLRRLFYRGKQKVIPNCVKSVLGHPQTLAVWYMEDGNIRREYGNIYGCILNSHSFTKKDNQKLSQWLKELYGLEANLQKNHGKYRLYIRATSWRRFIRIIAPYVVQAMRYKLS